MEALRTTTVELVGGDGRRRAPPWPPFLAIRHSSFVILLLLLGCGPRGDSRSTPLESKLFSAVQVIGTRGVAPGQFNKPRSLVCDREDNLYVADITGRIQKFSSEGQFLLQWQMPQTDLGKPKGMTLDRDGNIVVVEPHYMRVNHFTPGGRLLAQWGVKGTNAGEFILPRAIVQNSRGEFLVSEYTVVDRVQRFAAEVADTNVFAAKAVSLDPRPWLRQVLGAPGMAPGEFNRAEGLGMGPNDELFVADSCNHRIQVFDRDGKFLRAHGRAGSNPGEFSYPYDVRVDSAGNQFVCEFGNSRITVFDAQDRVVEVIGGAGAAPGKFANPWAIAFDSKGNLYVADSQNHRVQKLVRKPAATK
jgi:DNA-binding beta-propeller fold protein YncE